MENTQNLCPNNNFEFLQEAAARLLPQDWLEVRQQKAGIIDVSSDTMEGKWSLHLQTTGDELVGINSAIIPVGRGEVKFYYKVSQSQVQGDNLTLYVIGLINGLEVDRVAYHPQSEHIGDEQWHEATVEFDFTGEQVMNCVIGLRINENVAHTGIGDWLIDSVEVYSKQLGAKIRLAQIWVDNPLAYVGDSIQLSTFVENTGDEDSDEINLELTTSNGIKSCDSLNKVVKVTAGSFIRVDWKLVADQPDNVKLQVFNKDFEGKILETLNYSVLILDTLVTYTRQEINTNEKGFWRLLERPVTMQQENKAPLNLVHHLKSSEIKKSTYGICTHLPRSRDYEDIFIPQHLIDGNPISYWSSQQNSSMYPGSPPWVQIHFTQSQTISQVNLVPYWHNAEFPIGFYIQSSNDNINWDLALRITNHQFDNNGPLIGDKIVQRFPLPASITAKYIRLIFDKLPLAGGTYAEVSQGYKARLSGVEVMDSQGQNIALANLGATVSAINYFTGWNNTAKTVNESFENIMDIGLKWVRVGQWGDQTEWAAVEREKGKFLMDSVTDNAINELLDNGVDILYGLDYGNALYERPDKPYFDIGPIFQEGHPFEMNQGPRTEEGRQAFTRYVDFVVRKYGNRIKWWELWNEQNGWFPGHEPELYGKLLYAVAKHIKSIDPNLKVMFGGTAAPAPLTTAISLDEGAAQYLDATAFHPYGIDKPEGGMGTMEFHNGISLGQSKEQTGWMCLEAVIEGVKEPFYQHNKNNIEVWLNEWGTNVTGLDFAYNPGIGEFGCTKYMMRFYIYSGWIKLPASWWALYNENKSQDWGILDQKDYGFRPMSYALQNICSVVSDVDPLPTPNYLFDGNAFDLKVVSFKRTEIDETLILIWSADLMNEEIREYPGKFMVALPMAPTHVDITDLYWGVKQEALWSFENGYLVIDKLIVKDYPLVIVYR